MRANKVQNQVHKIALYVRVSTEEQAANPEGSIKSQEQRLRQYVQMRNLESTFGEVVAVFIDRARSGKDTNRPELQRLLATVRNKEATLVMVTELSRLSRSIKDFCEIWELLRAHGCEFQSLREQFDTTCAAGEMVLYTIANIAQFERKQIGERVTANFKARAERGLYNGGTVPLGYQLNPDNKGVLLVDDDGAATVREVFATYLREESILGTAKNLNRRGFKLKRFIQGGGRNQRLDHFTVSNTSTILKNKAYIGVREFQVNGELKSAKALWPAIVDERLFTRAQEIMARNKKHQLRLNARNRYPYLLTSIASCGTCGSNLAGKTGNGNGGRFAYYEHAWATKKAASLTKKVFQCEDLIRFSGRVVEPMVWQETLKLMRNPELANAIIEKANRYFETHSHVTEKDKLRTRIAAMDEQLNALAQHLTKIPKNVSPLPIFQQMEKLETTKAQLQKDLDDLSRVSGVGEKPAAFKDYQNFLKALDRMAHGNPPGEVKAKIVSKLVHKVELSRKRIRVHYYVGEGFTKQRTWEVQQNLENAQTPLNAKGAVAGSSHSLFSNFGSNKVEIGWGGRIRTCEYWNQNPGSYRLTTPQSELMGQIDKHGLRYQPMMPGIKGSGAI